ncbi:MAG: Gfo/Idh/MocA family oxidoreductase [Spirochaetales bacterium]|nr:Gfo/Idh/MocA family oxidoreductase [Spirochaetales bacterium]
MPQLAAGIIGAGKIAQAHLKALQRLECARPAAVSSRDRSKGEALCASYGIPRWYDDYHRMLKEEQLDVVHNCTPNTLHYQINKDIILSGRHVLSEKPLTCSARESEELAELALQHGVTAGVNFVYRHYPAVASIRDLTLSGELGDLWAIHGSYLQDWLADARTYDWRTESALAGPSRAIADIGSHWLDMAMFLFGQKIVRVCADTAIFIPERWKPAFSTAELHVSGSWVKVDTEDFAILILEFEKGARGCVTLSQVCHGRRSGLSFTIEGSRGSAAWSHERPQEIDLQPPPVKPAKVKSRSQTGIGSHPDMSINEFAQAAMVEDFYSSILTGKPGLHASFDQAWQVDRVIEAALASTREGKWIRVPAD